MKLLLIAAAMVGSAYGACIAALASEVTTANVVCDSTCMAILTATEATAAATCAAGWTGTATATTCGAEGGKLTWGGCTTRWGCTDGTTATSCVTCAAEADRTSATTCLTCIDGSFPAAGVCAACTCPTGQATCTCTSAAAADTVPATCSTGYQYAVTAGVTEVPAVAATAQTCDPVAAATAGSAKVDGVTAVPATCTQCAGSQTGCATDTAATCAVTEKTATSTIKLACTKASDNYSLTAGIASACSGITTGPWTATWVAQNTLGTLATCTAATCNTGYKVNTATVVACQENTCKATAVPAGYTATGITAIVAAGETAGVTADICSTPKVVGVTFVAAVTVTRDAILASAATQGVNLGVVACATGFTGTPAANCPVDGADKDFAYTGCAAAAAPASVAQTMIACVLAVVAMYL